jgi:hypothetical protein
MRLEVASGDLVLAALFLCLLVLGGASRADALSQALGRATAVALVTAVFWSPRDRYHPLDCRLLVYLLVGWTGLMLVQLIPLPPSLWSALPGREIFVQFFGILDRPLPWRPLTVETDATANSLLAMLVPWSVLLMMTLRMRHNELLVEIVLIVALIGSLALGALQMASGGRSFYFYEITNLGSPVGLFSNRNHNAFMVIMLVPLVTRVLLRRAGSHSLPLSSLLLLAGQAFAVAVNILVIGSRMGLVLLLLTAAATWVQLRLGTSAKARVNKSRPTITSHARYWAAGGAVVVLAALAAFLLAFNDRFTALSRLLGSGGEEDRLVYLPWLLKLAREYFPVGAGFGTFPTVFKMIEPDSLLQLSYLNHAHNDLLEIVVEGGLLAVLLTLAFAAAWLARSYTVWTAKRDRAGNEWLNQARLGSVLSGILLFGSATDYPLRTPACAAVFSVACYWLFRQRSPATADTGAGA